jgi:hypothetical protein
MILPLLCFGSVVSALALPGKGAVAYSSSGLSGRYFDGYWYGNANFFTLNTPVFSRTDSQINFSDTVYNQNYSPALTPWGFGGTVLADEETFSVEWTGQLEISAAGTYDFQILSDDGIELFIDNIAVISNPFTHAPMFDTGTIALAAGSYPLRMVYGEEFIVSVAQLSWRAAGTPTYNVINTVPGPLPVMGVGMALSFGRKLRARMGQVSRATRQV